MHFNIIKKIFFLIIFSLFLASGVLAYNDPGLKITDLCTDDSACGKTEYCAPRTSTYGRLCRIKKDTSEACTASNECKTENCQTAADGTKKCVDLKTGAGTIEWQPLAPTLQINIPTIQPFTTEGLKKVDPTTNAIYVPFLGQYLAGIYRWALGIFGTVCVVLIIMGAFIYMTAAGSAERVKQGRDRMLQALLGLLLLLSSFTILYIINPDLVRLKNLEIKVIPRETMIDYSEGIYAPDIK